MKTLSRSVFLVVITLATTAVAQPYSYMKLSDTDAPDLFSKRALIQAHGGRIVHEFPPNEFICEIDTAQFRILTDRYALDATQDSLSSRPRADAGLSIARYCFERLTAPSPPPGAISTQETDTIPFACGTSVITEPANSKQRSDDQALSVSRLEMFNANYLIGKTAVCIVLPLGPSGTRIWEYGEELEAIGEVVEAYDQLSRDANERNVDVTWVYEMHFSVPVGEEPIENIRPNSAGGFGWLDDISSYLGEPDGWEGLFGNANRLRREYQTDWGLTYYVIKNNPDENFPPGNIRGYTKLYEPGWTFGDAYRVPYAVSVFNRGATHETADLTIAHETLHIYGAADEYGDDCDDCSKGYGFLYVLNSNCTQCVGEKETCIMQSSDSGYVYCQSTIGQIGWTDSDTDGHPDAIDLNNDKWYYFEDVQPGDLVTVMTTSFDVVRNISVTENKLDISSTGTSTYFDCANYQSQSIAPGYYYVSINGGAPSTWLTVPTDPSVIPNVYDVGYDSQSGSLTWEISNSFCFIDLEIMQLGAQAGDTVLLAKPGWNRFYLTTTNTEPKTLDVSDIYCDPCIAQFSAWRPDGNANSDMVQYVYSNPYPCCGLYTGGMTGNTNCDIEGKRNLADLTRLIDHVYGSKAPLCCHNNGNTDGSLSGEINLADISRLIDHVYYSKAETEPCP